MEVEDNSTSEESTIPNSESLTRYCLVIGVATPVSLAGICTNALLLYLFRQKKYSETSSLYLAALAFLDILLCIFYIPMFNVDMISTYHHIPWLHWTWYRYVLTLLTLSRMTQLASTYMILATSMERFLMVLRPDAFKKIFTSSLRKFIIGTVFLLSIAMRASTFWEYKVMEDKNATHPMDRYHFYPVLARQKWYRSGYNLYFMNFFQVFIPFIFLTLLNGLIIYKMKKTLKTRRRNVFKFATVPASGHQKLVKYVSVKLRLQSATYTTVAIVTTYLICNSLDLFVKILENFASKSTILYVRLVPFPVPTKFYRLAADLISIFFAFNSFLRLFIYWACNREVQSDLHCLFRKKIFKRKHSKTENAEIVNNGLNNSVSFADFSVNFENSVQNVSIAEVELQYSESCNYGAFHVPTINIPDIDNSDDDNSYTQTFRLNDVESEIQSLTSDLRLNEDNEYSHDLDSNPFLDKSYRKASLYQCE